MFITGMHRFSRLLSRPVLAFFLLLSGVLVALAPINSEAARLGGGGSFGRQSSGVTSQRAPATVTQKSAMPAQAAAPAQPSGSRWLGPLTGIAAGLGIGMLLSHFGFGGAMGDMLTLLLLAAVVFFAIRMLLRLFLGAQSQTAAQSAAGLANAYNRQGPPPQAAAPVWQQTSAASVDQSGFGQPAGAQSSEEGGNWFIPADFDTQTFLQEAKKHFVAIQKVWDTGDIEQLRNFLTDDLLKALQGQFDGRQGVNQTEVVLLNAEMLGMEKVTDGHLASVRFSGMLREQPQSEAFRFEEVWNLFKPEQGGWLLAGIQQIPLSMAS